MALSPTRTELPPPKPHDSSQAASPALDADLAAPRAPSTSSLTLRLAPGLPAELLVEGRRYALVNVPYRGTHVSVEYVVERVGPEQSQGAALVAQVTTPDLTMCRVLDDGCETTHEAWTPARAHQFKVRNGGLYLVELRLG
jgi:hypothetical protein